MKDMNKTDLSSMYSLFHCADTGIGAFAVEGMHDKVHEHLSHLDQKSLTKVQLNQLFVLSNAGSVSDGFFQYYWCTIPEHTYDVEKIRYYNKGLDIKNIAKPEILSHDHLRWGLYRFYVDALLYFGNISDAFAALRSISFVELTEFFAQKRFDTESIKNRGPSLDLQKIIKDDRYLISEMVCKNFGDLTIDGDLPADKDNLREKFLRLYRERAKKGKGSVPFKLLIADILREEKSNPNQLTLSFDELLEDVISDESDLIKKFDGLLTKYSNARQKAQQNTDLYLSMVNDLDIYVATSMRTRQNFREMADTCDAIFRSENLKDLHLRYFDPTMSAARGHEDKGLIECLMVKCAKVVIYTAGEKESYGKDAEAAMALSLGKPVIFHCDENAKDDFYKNVHPLSRLIDFRSGVAVGAIVSSSIVDTTEILRRIFSNEMEYEIKHHDSRDGYLKLHEKLTGSVVRLQTEDPLLTTTFWNNYHKRQPGKYITLAAGKEAERLQE